MKFIAFIFLTVLNYKTLPTPVYICNSENAKKYHLKAKCKGLSTCQYKIITISLEKVKKQGKTLCNWEK